MLFHERLSKKNSQMLVSLSQAASMRMSSKAISIVSLRTGSHLLLTMVAFVLSGFFLAIEMRSMTESSSMVHLRFSERIKKSLLSFFAVFSLSFLCKNHKKSYDIRMIFSFFRRGTFLLLLLLSTSVWADTLTKEATYYSDSFDGGTTANGEKFSQNDFSAAICDMALGQYLYVSTGSTGIVVSANDRPNCRKYPDVIDLSREAFRVLSPLGVGRISGISVTSIGSASKTPKGFLTSDVFAHL